tara:strand:+ start:743 stop:1498 length:756 start_codon:yes stop_codon:yes gene_type:complete
MSSRGWIKLHRALLDWQWFSDPNTTHVFMYCLLKANHKDSKYRDTVVKAGTFLTGRDLISRETGCSVREVRTALKRLKSSNVLTIKTSRQGTVIEIVNYARYQQSDQQNDQRATNERPTNDQQATTNKNEKKEKKEKNTPSGESEGEDLFEPKPKKQTLSPPSREEFIAYAVETLPKSNPDWSPEQATRCAYQQFETYVDQNWHDGNGKPVKNWKRKSINSMLHKKPWSFGSNPKSFVDQKKIVANKSSSL